MTSLRSNDKTNVRTIARVASLVACLTLAVTGCGAADDSSVDPKLDNQIDEPEIGELEEAFLEATCGSTTPDVIMASTSLSVTSPNETYDHATCRHTYIAQKNDLSNFGLTGRRAAAKYMGGMADGTVFPCWGMWVQVDLWKRVPGAAGYVHVNAGPLVSGTSNGAGGCKINSSGVVIPTGDPAGTDYRIMGQAGYGNVYRPVQLWFPQVL